MGILAYAFEAQRLAMERFKAEGRKTIIGRWCSRCDTLVPISEWETHKHRNGKTRR